MDMDRRGFLQLLGLGTTGTLVGLSQPWPLFGSEDAPLVTMPQGISRHQVVYSPAAGGQGRLFYQVKNPYHYREEYISEYFVIPEDGDFHVPFYQVSQKIRDHFTTASTEMLTSLTEFERKFASLVTVVDVPIHMMEGHDGANGAWALTSYQQFVVIGEADVSGYEHYSSTGEYPIQVPDTIQMKILMALDRSYLTDGRLMARNQM